MIRSGAYKKKRKCFARLFTPVVPPGNLPVIRTANGKFKLPGQPVATCACGEPWVVAFPGQLAFPARTVNDQGMTCAFEPAVLARDDLYLCIPCARARGWPNLSSETTEGEDDEPAIEFHRAGGTTAAGDDEAGDQEGG